MAPSVSIQEGILASLDLPISNRLTESLAGVRAIDVWRHADRLLDAATAREVWLQWHPDAAQRMDDARFAEPFRNFLARGLELGYRLDRFKAVSERLPDPTFGARNWITAFEDVLSGDDCCTLRLYLSRERYQSFRASNRESATNEETWDRMLEMMTDGLFYELGIVFRPLVVAVDDALSPPGFRLEWNDLRLPAEAGLDERSVLVNETPERLRLLNINGTPSVNPANGNACSIIDRSYEEAAKSAGLNTWDARGYAILCVSAAVRRAASALVNRSFVELYLLRLREYAPDFVTVTSGIVEADFLVQILRGLLDEDIGVRDLSAILQATTELRAVLPVDFSKFILFAPPTGGVFADAHRKDLSELVPADYVEFVRWALRRYISHKYTRGQNTLIVYLLDPEIEERLARPEVISNGDIQAILEGVEEEMSSIAPGTREQIILTTTEVRRFCWRLIAPRFPQVKVLSYQELSADMNIQPIARISATFT